MIPDLKERETALDPSRSFIVEAPAGSGKTALLIQRYLRLLSVVDRPESVVAMTFTRKAAAEMKERVYRTLECAAKNVSAENDYERQSRELASDALKRAAQRGWDLLSDPHLLQIQTIDSLCAMLTRHMPLVSHLGGYSEVVEEASELYRLAARRTLRFLTEGGEDQMALFRRLVLHFDNDMSRLEIQVANMLQQREKWRDPAAHDSQVVNDFCQLLSYAHSALREVFRERSAVDFTEVTRAAIAALGTADQPADLLYWLDYRIEHLLVDEFQDTSRAQYDLIDALTSQWSDDGSHTLFLVGDPMQSIYRFREAEVSLFLRSWHERRLGAVRLHQIRLTSNFRSTPEIVKWTQAAFSKVMTEEDISRGSVQLRPAGAVRAPGNLEPEIIQFIGDAGQEEARTVTGLVRRALPKGTVAILVRSRSHVPAILSSLREAGIGYEATEMEELKNQQHVIDLISLTRAILHLGDRLSWLACLRAPWCGLTLADLSALAEGETSRTVLDLLSDPEKISSLSPDGRIRAVRVQEILLRAVTNIGRVPLRTLIEQTWLALGGPAILGAPNQLEDVQTFLNLLETFEQRGTALDFSLLNQRLEYLYAKPESGENYVQVLTIHKAKGLEFDTVIVPKLGAAPRPSEQDLLVWTEHIDESGNPSFKLAAQPRRGENDADYEAIIEENKLKDAEEIKRLFYVAVTRSKNRLHLLANVNLKKDGSACNEPQKYTFLKLIWDSVKDDFEFLRRSLGAVQMPLPLADSKPKTILRRLPVTWRAPRFERAVNWQPELKRAIPSARKITYEWVSDTRRHIGTVVHELLKRMAGNSGGVDDFRPIIHSELLRLGVARPDVEAAVAQVVRALQNTLQSKRGSWILQPHPEARSEWELQGRVGQTLITGSVDRAFPDEEGRFWIIDFKTSEHEGSRLNAFLDEEQRRYKPQLESYAALASRLSTDPIWLGLYFPLHDAWREWQFEEATIAAG